MRVAVPTTPHVCLRVVKDDDHPWLVDLHNDPVVLRNMLHPEPITLESHHAWWDKIKHDPRQLRQVFEVAGERVGFAKFYDIDHTNRNCVLGGDIHRDHRGKGYAKWLWTRMLERCFEVWGLHRVGLTAAEYNTIGQRVYLGLGFKEEGRVEQQLYRDGRYHDAVNMRLLRTEWDCG